MSVSLSSHPVSAVCLAALKQQLLEQGAASSADVMAGSHCLSRACIRASVAASLAALRLETLDLLYLHNAAEVQLLARGKAGFMEVLRAAFQELEALRQEVSTSDLVCAECCTACQQWQCRITAVHVVWQTNKSPVHCT